MKEPKVDADLEEAIAALLGGSRPPARKLVTIKDRVARRSPAAGSAKALRDKPAGTLTRKAANAIAGVLSDATGNRDWANRTGEKLETLSQFVNPLSWADMAGTSARYFYDEGGVGNAVDAGLNALGIIPGGKIAAGAGAALKPVLAALPAGKKIERAAEEMIPFRHYSFSPDLKQADPAKWGTNPNRGFIPREESSRRGMAPGRTYIGLDDGPQPYRQEGGVGRYEYRGQIPRSRLYDMGADPDGLKAKGRGLYIKGTEPKRYDHNGASVDGTSLYERLIQEAGYAGYWVDDPNLGRSGALFEPVDLEFIRDTRPGPDLTPLEGLPSRIRIGGELTDNGPDATARLAANRYMDRVGLPYHPPKVYARVDPTRAARIAAAYEAMPHDPTNPQVRQSYDALIRETLEQYRAAKDAGMRFQFMPNDRDNKSRIFDPYSSPWDAIQDIRNNKRLQVFPTDAGYGQGAITDDMVAANPLLAKAEDVYGWGGFGLSVRNNDVFRAVHDFYGHAKEGVGFRADGEENAFRAHAAMYSPEALPALATETRGQNSWLNFGPFGERNRTAKTEDTVFADQKIGLLPDWAIYEGNEDFLTPPAGILSAPRNPKK